MKKIGCIIALLFVIQHGLVHSEELDKKYSIQFNPLLIITDVIMGANDMERYSFYFIFDFQTALNDHWNFVIRPNIFMSNDFRIPSFVGEVFGGSTMVLKNNRSTGKDLFLSVMPGVLYRPAGRGLRGIYFGLYPNIGWEKLTIKSGNSFYTETIEDNFLILGARIETGYSWIYNNGFSITLGGGLERNWGVEMGEVRGEYETSKYLYKVRLNTMLGYSF